MSAQSASQNKAAFIVGVPRMLPIEIRRQRIMLHARVL
jgi:hypothetical protein